MAAHIRRTLSQCDRQSECSVMLIPMPVDLDRLFAAAACIPRLAGRGLVKAYRYSLSPLVGFHCRHLPTCSQYADEALSRFGLWAGSWMTLGRLCRCHPWGTSGLDFVPATLPPGSRWYLPWRYARWCGVNEIPPRPPSSGETNDNSSPA